MKEAGITSGIGYPHFFPLKPPFSNFDFVDSHFEGESAIRRLFSQARSHGAKTLIAEALKAEGVLLSENKELSKTHPGYKMTGLKRLSFWKRQIRSIGELRKVDPKDLLGYFIAKRDCIPSLKKNDWHV